MSTVLCNVANYPKQPGTVNVHTVGPLLIQSQGASDLVWLLNPTSHYCAGAEEKLSSAPAQREVGSSGQATPDTPGTMPGT